MIKNLNKKAVYEIEFNKLRNNPFDIKNEVPKFNEIQCAMCKKFINDNKMIYCFTNITFIKRKKVGNRFINFRCHPDVCNSCYKKIKEVIE
jgi:hypothetical protein